jgi:hypothetical protein
LECESSDENIVLQSPTLQGLVAIPLDLDLDSLVDDITRELYITRELWVDNIFGRESFAVQWNRSTSLPKMLSTHNSLVMYNSLVMSSTKSTKSKSIGVATKPCSVGDCKNKFSPEDSHSKCYLHLSCPRTKKFGDAMCGNSCIYCDKWSESQIEAHRFRALVRLRSEKRRLEKSRIQAESLD